MSDTDDSLPAYQPLQPADALADASELPFSPRYGDVYHAAAGALAQAQHVFLKGNGLPGRWRGRPAFTVCETGFGLGLNFLALWAAWRDDPQRSARLHMVSFEAHPFTADALAHWHGRLLPGPLQALGAELRAAWPRPLPGLHRLDLAGGAVTLTLGLGDARLLAPQVLAAVDAFFLDGFAPARNPAMWSAELLADLAALARPEATVATWTSAGVVRRALAATGCEVRKVAGFAGKREMTVGRWPREHAGGVARAMDDRVRAPSHAVVVGGGLAGSSVASALARRGWQVTQVAPPAGDEGRGHWAAALTPAADARDTVRARLVRAGALRATGLWRPWTDRNDPAACVRDVGTLQVAGRRAARSVEATEAWQAGLQALDWPSDWLRRVDAREAAALAGQPVGRPAVFYGGGLQVRPVRLCRAWRQAAGVRELAATVTGWQALPTGGSRLTLELPEGRRVSLQADLLVFAAAGATPALLRARLAPTAGSGASPGMAPLSARRGDSLAEPGRRLPPLHHVAGQISGFAATGLKVGGPRCIVAGDGYVLPALEGWCVVGSTYDHDARWGEPAPVRDSGHQLNQAALRRLLPLAQHQEEPPAPAWGWAGWRAVVSDRLPTIGWLGRDVAVATAFGSRGLAWAGLAGDLLAGDLAAEPGLIERELRDCLLPQRPLAGESPHA
ncbi:MAG: tRNA (5-methylaminomethyl-2-thiouridine)(34)-methyltransferase MnmD [Pigmentiphaga sp.]|nr:tRNA (5-methylaminomethyl-2-thiouridine)(34)-methyltransferase MnmD [Pigmentiphaga sp.]